jgi:RNA polymerase sigma-70 factor (ECF subfamily)
MGWGNNDQGKDEEAFANLFQQYKNLVFKTAYLMLGSTEEAEDALQEVFLSVHRALGTFDPSRAAFTTWIYRITVNQCLNRRRKRRITILPLGETAASYPSPESQVMTDQTLEHALNGLSDKLRSVVVLRYYADLPYAEIGEILDVPLGTVKSRLNQALETLRRSLEPSREGDIVLAGVIPQKENAE